LSKWKPVFSSAGNEKAEMDEPGFPCPLILCLNSLCRFDAMFTFVKRLNGY